ncbi:MAG: hypothetical protein K2I06_07595 [Ruminococcus sp.]|nr:hypothetical protein [Ruminococcus sp.]
MKKFSTYLPSLIASVMLVFMIIGTSLVLIININVTDKKSIALAEENNICSSIHDELEKYFNDQYNTTGVPSQTYMNALDENYLNSVINLYTESLFSSLKTGKAVTVEIPKNQNLESNIEEFFSRYADDFGYEKDETYQKKLQETKDSAYRIIENYCDVYKYSTLQNHGVLTKISEIYSHMNTITIACFAVSLFFVLLLLLINRRSLSVCLYWTGISSLIAGLFGTLPSVYLLSSKYFDSFVIKQPQVFKSFTSAMYGLTKAFMSVHIAILLIGICLIILYAVVNKMLKKSK